MNDNINHNDRFTIEVKDYDFPFYNNNPHVSKTNWLLMFLSLIVSMIFLAIFTDVNMIFASIGSVVIILIPVLKSLKWDVTLIFRKPTVNDVFLVVTLFGGYLIYAVIVAYLLTLIGIGGTHNPVYEMNMDTTFFISVVFDLLDEEFIKFIPFCFFLTAFYKLFNNRKLAIILTSVVIMIFFGLLHAQSFSDIIFVLIIQGFGSIFELYGYIKTKNLLVPYITHLLTDMFIFFIFLVG